jgi:hypothetical protein
MWIGRVKASEGEPSRRVAPVSEGWTLRPTSSRGLGMNQPVPDLFDRLRNAFVSCIDYPHVVACP